ncbi:hypothetical protein DFH28DRAFT_857452, partial [Melampsora americana]
LATRPADLPVRLRVGIREFNVCQKTFNWANFGFMPTLAEYHNIIIFLLTWAKNKIYMGSFPTTPVTSEHGSPLR